ncbi:RES domain-containing protein [Colletotrichum asianum]|uniref:DUF7730 domain-containing protein n=1 Tax=Colletotrichum asianum TaxID=702518 RepID=A0A8H3WGA2_9PEZI|nr:hypothetical protein GQ607_007518 [Colletotrichum asianum]
MLAKLARKLHRPGSSASRQSQPDSSRSAPKADLPVIPAIPAISTPRSRPITPPSCEPSGNFGIFEHIPLEIRRQILIEAFGEQTIHIDLVYDRPRIEQQDAPHKEHRFRRAPRPTGKEVAAASALYKLKTKQWQWYSCVCHAKFPSGTSSWSRFSEPCDDSCAGNDHVCEYWPGEAPSKCSLGIMGWLCSCRQAYVEGLDVLFGTNTFRIQDMVILRNAQQLFLPHRWAAIPRLEIQCFFSPYGWMLPAENTPPVNPLPLYCQKEPFYDLMGHLPDAFRNLQTLHLSLQSTTARAFSPWKIAHAHLEELMKPVESMLRQLPPTVRECTVAVPSSLFWQSRDKAKEDGRTVEHFYKKQKERHWCELSSPNKGISGYWLQLGKTDLSAETILPNYCFGSGAGRNWRDDMNVKDEDLIIYGLHWL